MKGQLLGQFLAEQSFITQKHLELALEKQNTDGERLGQILIGMNVLDEGKLAGALAAHFGFERINWQLEPVNTDLLETFPEAIANHLQALPLNYNHENAVRVAIVDPFDLDSRRTIEFTIGKAIQPVVLSPTELKQAISHRYSVARMRVLSDSVEHEEPKPIKHLLDIDIEKVQMRLGTEGVQPYVEMLNHILVNAKGSRSSDVHLEPMENELRVRYRIDGDLHEIATLPKWIERGLISRIKVVGRMDVTNRLDPQDGQIRAMIADNDMDMRISTVPSQYGETCVIRLLDPAILSIDLQDLGMNKDHLITYQHLISQPQGMMLISGPTGSGKSTTLYATINRLRHEQTSITTVEDPVEYNLPGITQIQVNNRRGLNFTTCIRSLMRQDPDVLIIGEIRDTDTASTAFQAAITGHLVFSTVHSPDIVSTITRIRDLGVPLYLTGASLIGIMAQRLVRQLCPYCSTPGSPRKEEWLPLEMDPMDLPRARLLGPGCLECQYTGYRGRIGIFEIQRIEGELQRMIHEGRDESEIRKWIYTQNIRDLIDDGIDKVAAGITSLAEIMKQAGSREKNHGANARRRTFSPHIIETSAPIVPVEAFPIPEIPVEPVLDLKDTPSETAEYHFEDSTLYKIVHDRRTILIVNDSQNILSTLQQILQAVGLRVLAANSGAHALETIESHVSYDPIHLVLLDVLQPDMTGFDLIRKLRTTDTTASIPILMLGSGEDREEIKEGLRSGSDDVILKPFDIEELELRIQALLRRAYGNHLIK